MAIVITGGQTGADLAGWIAAKSAGYTCTGYMGSGFKTEDGFHPEYAELYGAMEIDSPDYAVRRMANLRLCGESYPSCLAIVFDGVSGMSRGTRGLLNDRRAILEASSPCPHVEVIQLMRNSSGWTTGNPASSAAWLAAKLRRMGVIRLLVAGNRESSSPGIGAFVEGYLAQVFRVLREDKP